MTKRLFLTVVAVASAAVGAEEADEGLVRQSSSYPWHFRIGPVMAPRVRVKLNGPTAVMPTVPGDKSGTYPGAVPSMSGDANRQYANGYVNTPDPGTAGDGQTWYWGADDVNGQYQNGLMTFTTANAGEWSETSTGEFGGESTSSQSDRDILLGFEAMGGWTFWDGGCFDATLDAGFRFYGSGQQNLRSSSRASIVTTRTEYRYVDGYTPYENWTPSDLQDYGFISDTNPGYDGESVGDFGPLLGATPTSRNKEAMSSSTRTETYSYSSHTKLNYRIWDLRMGPTFGWKATEWMTLRGGIYALLGLIDAELKTSSGYNTASKRVCKPLFGLAPGVSAQVNLTEHLSLIGSIEYDWWTESLGMHAGGAGAQMKLSDFSVSLALGWDF